MEPLLAFVIAFAFSFAGSIPPATINLSVMQLGLDNKMPQAWRFALAASIVEYPYAFIALTFEKLLNRAPLLTQHFQLIAAVVMLTFGILNLTTIKKNAAIQKSPSANSTFRQGLLLGILNPLAIPYWFAMTAYIKAQHWLALDTALSRHAFFAGVSIGAFTLLICVALLAKKISAHFTQSMWIKRVPGVCMLVLGVYALVRYSLTVGN